MNTSYENYTKFATKVISKLGSDDMANMIKLKILEKIVTLDPNNVAQEDDKISFTGLNDEGLLQELPAKE